MNHGQVVDIISEFRPPSMYAEEYDSLANFAQLEYMDKCIESKNEDALLPFEAGVGTSEDTPPLIVSPYGVALLPSDYRPYFPFESFAFFYDNREVPVEPLDHKQFDYRKYHPTETPTKRYPICCIHSNHVAFLPKNLGFVNFKYLRKPVWVHMELSASKGYAEYNPVGSIEFEWNDTHMVYIIQGILNLMNIPATLEEINSIKNKGGKG